MFSYVMDSAVAVPIRKLLASLYHATGRLRSDSPIFAIDGGLVVASFVTLLERSKGHSKFINPLLLASSLPGVAGA